MLQSLKGNNYYAWKNHCYSLMIKAIHLHAERYTSESSGFLSVIDEYEALIYCALHSSPWSCPFAYSRRSMDCWAPPHDGWWTLQNSLASRSIDLSASSQYKVVIECLRTRYAPKGNEVEWQFKLQNRMQKPGEKLVEFAGVLVRALANNA